MKTNRVHALATYLPVVVCAFIFPLVQENVVHAQTQTNATAKRPVPDRVLRFCRDAVNFTANGDDHQVKAKQFATKFCASITANKPRETSLATNSVDCEASTH